MITIDLRVVLSFLHSDSTLTGILGTSVKLVSLIPLVLDAIQGPDKTFFLVSNFFYIDFSKLLLLNIVLNFENFSIQRDINLLFLFL